MHKLVEAISGLTDSIKAPNLLTSKGNRYNDETMSQLFEAIKRNNNIMMQLKILLINHMDIQVIRMALSM